MMKTTRRLFTIILSMMLLVGAGCIFAFAEGETAATDEYGEDYQASYTVTVYSGKEGNFGGATEKSAVNIPYGSSLKIDLDDGIYVNGSKVETFGFSMDGGSIYYAKGLKLAGHDNDETAKMGYRSFSTTVTEDLSYSVAYAMKGSMVKYRVNYVDEAGDELLPSEEYYGMPGDYPVVSFKYVEGYAPDAYNLGRTLSENEGDNVFTFTYSESNMTAEEQAAAAAATTNAGARAAAAQPGAGAPAGDGAGAADGGANIGDNPTPRAGTPNVTDIDDKNPPTTQPPEDDKKGELSMQRLIALIIGGLCGVALIALLVAAILKRRNDDDDDDDDDDYDDDNDRNGGAENVSNVSSNAGTNVNSTAGTNVSSNAGITPEEVDGYLNNK